MAHSKYTPPLVIAVASVFPLLCTIIVGLRFYTRRLQGARTKIDDWLVLPALVSTHMVACNVRVFLGQQLTPSL